MEKRSDILLLLDLDETLIHASTSRLEVAEDFRFGDYYVYKRPCLEQFLQDISIHFQLGIWSSADDLYVEGILQNIKPANLEFVISWGRSRCSLSRDHVYDSYYYGKKLSKLKKLGYKLEQVLIVDDSPEKARSNYGNVIYITPFSGNHEDQELLHLYNYLLTLKEATNIRTIEKRGWRNNVITG